MSSASSIFGDCRLCQNRNINLCSSHLIPAAISRWIRTSNRDSGSSKGPIHVTTDSIFQNDYKVADYLLCRDCEERFNNGGERWVLDNTYRGSERFQLRSALRSVMGDGRALVLSQTITVIPSQATRGIDLQRIIYFASSVFWRAGAHLWKQIDPSHQISLGPYEEHLRRFLLAEAPFPQNAALIISVVDSAKPVLAAVYPYSSRFQTARQHRFSIPGMAFWLHLGRLPAVLTQLCAANAGVLCLAKNLDENMAREFRAILRTNRLARHFKAG
jgi:hypothetical protein